MATQIQETDAHRCMRILIKSVLVFSLLFGTVFSVSCIFVREYVTGAVAFLVVILLYGWINNNRVVKVNSVGDDSVTLNDGNKTVELKKEDISYVSKFVRFTVTKYFLLCIVVRDGKSSLAKRYLILNDAQSDLIESFRKMQIELRNIP